jgi:hypothetical protein
MKPVEADLIFIIQEDQHTTGQANAQPRYIDKAVHLVPFQITDSDLNIIVKHGFSLIGFQ